MGKTQQCYDSQKMAFTPSALPLAARRETQEGEWLNIKGERAKCVWVGVTECMWMCVHDWKRSKVCVYEFVCVREGEMEDIIRSYWKMKEKVISHVAHLPVCLKGLSAHMINKFYKHIYKKIFLHLSDKHNAYPLCLTAIVFMANIGRRDWLTGAVNEAEMWCRSRCLAHKTILTITLNNNKLQAAQLWVTLFIKKRNCSYVYEWLQKASDKRGLRGKNVKLTVWETSHLFWKYYFRTNLI